MSAIFEKRWPLISLLLLLALLACLLFWPGVARPLGLTVLLVSLTASILLVTQKHVRAYRKGQLEWATLVRNLAVEISGVLLTFVAIWFVAGRVVQSVGLAVGTLADVRWPGSGTVAGLLAGVLVGLMIGLAVGGLVQTTWGRLVKHPRALKENEA
jgi:hypothetical protein